MSDLSLTIGIPTCYSGPSLLETAKGIRATEYGDTARFIIWADRTPLTEDLKQELAKLNVEVFWNDVEGSWGSKAEQIIKETKTDILVLTQDDITFEKDSISGIVAEFEKSPDVTMVGSRVLPLKPQGLIERGLATMVRLVDRISRLSNTGDNYLAASGRCMSFRTHHVQQFRFITHIVNGDMFYYLENIRLGGKFAQADDSRVFIRCPQNMKDQMGPSSRFQYSRLELTKYFDMPIESYYQIPLFVVIRAVCIEFVLHPIAMAIYVYVFFISRWFRKPPTSVLNPLWKVDVSTKQ